jgi:excisionase family DNA binding protein
VRAYTVSSLAAEWHCSEGTIRKLIGDGELGCFRLGTLIRIPAEEVARFETTQSNASEEATPSSGARTGSGGAGSSTRPIAPQRKRKRGPGGLAKPTQAERLVG